MTLLFYCFVDDFIEEQGLRRFPYIRQEGGVWMKAFHFFDAKDIGIFFMVHNEVEEHERLIKGDLAFGRFGTGAIDDVTLQTEQLGKNSDDNGSLSIFGEAKNNTTGFM